MDVVKEISQTSRICSITWNIRSWIGKLVELIDMMIRRRINIAYLLEANWIGEKAKEVGKMGYKLLYTWKDRNL